MTRVVTGLDKSFPPGLVGTPVTGLSVPLGDFATPLFVLDADALAHNLAVMAEWTAARGLELMPHGKTTMAPALWRRQLDAGATGITVATGWQAAIALEAGVPTVQLANTCADPVLWGRLASWLAEHPDQELVCWVDHPDTVARLATWWPTGPRLGVLVEQGAAGGRTGVRSLGELAALATQVADVPTLRLRGVAGYEGCLGHDRSPAALSAVRSYGDTLVAALDRVAPLVEDTPWITAGGSAYFDVVADAFAAVCDARRILRSGAYLVHDDGFYRGISPLDADRSRAAALLPAMRGYARVISVPEPGLALLDAGKRDLPFDEGLPVPLAVGADLGAPERPLSGVVTALNDQHTFLRWEGPAGVQVGEVVRLGLSHPCTAFDKWRLVPIAAGGTVVEAVETFF